jgi:hypothetical protein
MPVTGCGGLYGYGTPRLPYFLFRQSVVRFCLNGYNEWDEEGEHQKLDECKRYVMCYSSREHTGRRAVGV